MMLIHKDWTWAALFGVGTFLVGLALAIIALVHLWSSKVYDKFDNAARNQLFITSIVYISFVAAVFMVTFFVYLANRNPHGHVAQYMHSSGPRGSYEKTVYTSGGHPAIF